MHFVTARYSDSRLTVFIWIKGEAWQSPKEGSKWPKSIKTKQCSTYNPYLRSSTPWKGNYTIKAPWPFCRLLKGKCILLGLNITLFSSLSLHLTLISDHTNCLSSDENSLSCEKHFSWWHVPGRGKEQSHENHRLRFMVFSLHFTEVCHLLIYPKCLHNLLDGYFVENIKYCNRVPFREWPNQFSSSKNWCVHFPRMLNKA